MLGSILGALKSIVNVIGMTKVGARINMLVWVCAVRTLRSVCWMLVSCLCCPPPFLTLLPGSSAPVAPSLLHPAPWPLCPLLQMTPPIKELLPRLTPVLKNRHEKVQENCIDLVGRIADRGASFVPAREWMRICFELLEMLKAHKKAIRRATVNTFGYIAKAIGPQVGRGGLRLGA